MSFVVHSLSTDQRPNPSGLSAHCDEFRWIADIAAREAGKTIVGTTQKGIGDDAAFVPLTEGAVIATDTLLEGVHFDSTAQPEAIGHKAIAVNLSDFAAMAAVPKAATVAISVCRERTPAWVDRLMQGLQATAHEFGVGVVGGDTTSWTHPLAISVTVIGEPDPAGLITRSGGRPGDRLYVTGPLGGSLAGHHLSFRPRVSEALELVQNYSVHAMMDLSDGLASDLRHLTTASRCGAIVEVDALPLRSADLSIENALCDGEDFELLVALPPDCNLEGVEYVHEIGVLTNGPGIRYRRNRTDIDIAHLTGYSHRFGRES